MPKGHEKIFICGDEIPRKKKIKFALSSVKNLPLGKSISLLENAGIEPEKLSSYLSAEEISSLEKLLK